MKSAASHALSLTAGAFWHRLLIRLSTQATDDLRRLRHEPERAIHDLRKRMKKLRSVLRLGTEHISPQDRETISAAARDIKNAFGTERNQAVVSRLRLLLGDTGTPDAQPKKSSAALPRYVRPSLRQLQRLIAALSPPALTWKHLCAAHAQTYHAARKRMKRAQSGRPEDFHQWRKRVKDFYYQSLALYRLERAKKPIRQSRHLGSLLGKHHDLEVLRTSAGPELPPTALKQLLKKQAALEKKAFKLGARLFRHDPKHLRQTLLRCCPADG